MATGRGLGTGLAALLSACVPALPRSVIPLGHAGAEPWPDIAAPLPPRRDGRHDAALIISVEDYESLPDRPGAHAVAGAWYRYLYEVRGLRPRKIEWLRDAEVDRDGVRQALDRVHWRVGRDARLWLIFIGHAGTRVDRPRGVLFWRGARAGQPAKATEVSVDALLSRAGHGLHDSLVAILDGCLPEGTDPKVTAGLPAPGLLPGRQRVDPPFAPGSPIGGPEYRTTPAQGLKQDVGEALARTRRETDRKAREPSDAVVFTAGVGERCRERLPGADVPALSYLMLGALRGWGDENGNDQVGAAEALRRVDLLLRAASHGEPAVPRPQARGADVTLARGARESGPALTGVLPRDAVIDEAALLAEEGSVFVDEKMKKIDRGRFMMGCRSLSDRDCEPDERPARWTYLDSYALDRFEVTWNDYARCVGEGGCSKIDLRRCEVWTGEAFVRGAGLPEGVMAEDHPVVCATWDQAAAFCAWKGKRLPTEAEWERAARGPGERWQYPWGDQTPTCERAQTHECRGTTAAVGGRPQGASPEAIHDMAGNVSEWVADWYDRKSYWRYGGYNPVGPERGEVRVIRGGSYYEGVGNLRASYRYGLSPQWGYGTVGFRCAR